MLRNHAKFKMASMKQSKDQFYQYTYENTKSIDTLQTLLKCDS